MILTTIRTALIRTRTLRKYLLSELSPSQREWVERGYVRSAKLYTRLESIEYQLICDYLHQTLSGAAMQRFEKGYLISDARLARVAGVRGLLRAANTQETVTIARVARSSQRMRWLVLGAMSAALIAVGAVAAPYWLAHRTVVIALRLEDDSRRAFGSNSSVPHIPRLASSAHFELPLPVNDQYDLTIQGPDGSSLIPTVAHHQGAVTFDLPARLLKSGTYVLIIKAHTPSGSLQQREIRFDIIKDDWFN